MVLGSIHTPTFATPTPRFSVPTPPQASVSNGPADHVTLSGASPKRTTGTGQAIQLAGMGVMFGSIMAGAAMGGPWGPAVMIGGMFGGLAIMAYGRDK